MRYYLDFDRTLFDTDAFIAYLDSRGDLTGIDREAEASISTQLWKRAEEGTISFEPGELAQFLYPDSAGFLRDKENAVTVITYGDKAFQELKVKSALFGIPRIAVMYTGLTRKGEYLAPHTHLHTDAVLVDDTPLELELLASSCPTLSLYQMVRSGGEGDGRWPVISRLAELP